MLSKDESGVWQSRLIAARSRLAPIKTIGLPRLELCAAVMATQLATSIQEAIQEKGSVHYWSDSQIVFQWIAHFPGTWTVFVTNRVAKIQEKAPREMWRYVPTSDNPSDLLTRGSLVEPLLHNKKWWSGPEWLTMEEEYWPNSSQDKTGIQEIPEQRKQVCMAVVNKKTDLLHRYSSFSRLMRVVAYCRRFCQNSRQAKHSKNKLTGELSLEELDQAVAAIVRSVQHQAYRKDIQELNKQGSVSRSSELRSLDPFIDPKGSYV